MAGGLVLTVVADTASFAHWFTPYRDLVPSSLCWLGTDHLGRGVLSRLIFRARSALVVSIIVVAAAILNRLALGRIAGCIGGKH